MRVALRHQFVGAFGGGIQRQGPVRRRVRRERTGTGVSIDRGGACIDEMRDSLPPRQLQQVQMAGNVGPHIGARVLQRIAHACLRGEVQDAVHAVEPQPVHRLVIGNVGAQEGKAGQAVQPGQPGALQHRVVVAVEIVDADDGFAACEQGGGRMHADKAGDAGDEDAHGRGFRAAGRAAP